MVTNEQAIAFLDVIDRYIFFVLAHDTGNSDGKIGLKIAFKTQKAVGFNLEHFAQQHKENQTGKAVKKARAVIHHNIYCRTHKHDDYSQCNRDFDVEHTGFDALVGGHIITTSRIEKTGQSQCKNEPTEEAAVVVKPKFLYFKIFGKRQQHDVAKTKESHAQFVGETVVNLF